ncbi:non-heme iron oxygenase ferredoxin subunit [Amnibacterium flavum]|uniref:Non-heme iron oxygenase ferredoxin subunit n=1 Tax=Amnibacterium flavum TaxID=2173173 RepID=A0A2V1HVM7_9MICO|nr:non-heme iron oxygenase ferredoxin subunit [Amnibacterium flavum]PVZ94417.1 non-heme iron oxygenase ferredoxin subunit [Amnibacterium flavum]
MAAVNIGPSDEISVDQAKRVVLDGIAIAVVKDSAGVVHAIGDTCTHGDISLSEGFVEDAPSSDGSVGPTLECWAHGSRFELTTGKPLTLPAYEPVPVFEVTVVDGDVWIDPTPRTVDA